VKEKSDIKNRNLLPHAVRAIGVTSLETVIAIVNGIGAPDIGIVNVILRDLETFITIDLHRIEGVVTKHATGTGTGREIETLDIGNSLPGVTGILGTPGITDMEDPGQEDLIQRSHLKLLLGNPG